MPKLPPFFKFIQRGWFNCNSIIVDYEDQPTLIDSGHLLYANETVDLIRGAGVEPENLGLIVTTHGHSDHHGGNKLLKEMSNASILMGEITASWFRNNEKRLLWFDVDAQEAEIILPDQTIQDGEVVHFSGVPFEAVHLPGHAPDCLGFYQPDSKVMICADAMWENDFGVLNTAVHGPQTLADAETAVQKLASYDIEIAIPGHGNLITNVPENLEKLYKRLNLFKSDPAQLAWHFIRRIAMFIAMRHQPIEEQALQSIYLNHPHLIHYLKNELNLSHFDNKMGEKIFQDILENFKSRQLIVEKDGLLSSTVPK
ncbi:MAG: MBL fold metallo-hydrolase [Chloroflexota bacterium]